ncbi:MAG: hypothetical protein Phyf2KO_03820 [Phycisphaerales bacterium]
MISNTRKVILVLALLTGLAASHGCNILGPIYFFAVGPPEFDPEYKLEQEKTTVVFVDDPRSEIPRRAIRMAMIQAAESDLLERGLVDDLVSGQSALRVSQQDGTAGQMSVAEIGREVDCDIVIWATVDQFVRADMSRNQEPKVVYRVRVVDAENNQILWPTDPQGRKVEVTLNSRIGSVASDTGASTTAELQLGKNAGLALVQLFYEHLVTEHVAERGI